MRTEGLHVKTVFFAAAVAALAALPAQATTYLFDLSYAGHAASGFLTTDSNAPVSNITAISGTFDGVAITGLSTFAAADNILYSLSNPHFSFGGVSFVAGDVIYNWFGNGADNILNNVESPCGCNAFTPLDTSSVWQGGSQDVTQVPEPASWALTITGFGMIGAGLRRRRTTVAA
jgi:hypothetical protein